MSAGSRRPRRYNIEFTAATERQMLRVSEPHRTRLSNAIDRLAENPRPPGVTKLSGLVDLYRIRVGDYRVIYTISDAVVTVTVTRVGHRSEVYRP